EELLHGSLVFHIDPTKVARPAMLRRAKVRKSRGACVDDKSEANGAPPGSAAARQSPLSGSLMNSSAWTYGDRPPSPCRDGLLSRRPRCSLNVGRRSSPVLIAAVH